MGSTLATPKKTSQVLDHLYEVVGPFAAYCISLCILIQQFVLIQVRAVSGQKKQSDSSTMGRYPLVHFFGTMDRMPVYSQVHFLFRLLDQPARKVKVSMIGIMEPPMIGVMEPARRGQKRVSTTGAI